MALIFLNVFTDCTLQATFTTQLKYCMFKARISIIILQIYCNPFTKWLSIICLEMFPVTNMFHIPQCPQYALLYKSLRWWCALFTYVKWHTVDESLAYLFQNIQYFERATSKPLFHQVLWNFFDRWLSYQMQIAHSECLQKLNWKSSVYWLIHNFTIWAI